MEEKKENLVKKENDLFTEKKISRKEAIKKTGLVAASTATMMVLMKSQKAQACSYSPNKNGKFEGNNQQYRNNNNNQHSNGPWNSGNKNNNQHSNGPWGNGNNNQHSGGGSWGKD